MKVHDQSTTTPMEYGVADVSSTLDARTDDACTRLHLYQQQLRAELLAAAADKATRSSSLWSWLPTASPGQAFAALRTIESRVKALTGARVRADEATLRLAVAEA